MDRPAKGGIGGWSDTVRSVLAAYTGPLAHAEGDFTRTLASSAVAKIVKTTTEKGFFFFVKRRECVIAGRGCNGRARRPSDRPRAAVAPDEVAS